MQRACEQCAKPFEAQNVRARFCGTTCRVRASKARKAAAPPVAVQSLPSADGSNVAATRAQLDRLGKLDDPLGTMAMTAARRLDDGDTGSSMAALMRELRSLLAEAAKGSTALQDGVDEVAERRRLRHGA